jgi:pilus assembly protein Flp/PilA
MDRYETTLGEYIYMAAFRNWVARLHSDEQGQGLVEYALIMGLVVLAAVTTIQTLANEVNAAFNHVVTVLTSALGS